MTTTAVRARTGAKSPTISAPPSTVAPDWSLARCKKFDPELFFPIGTSAPALAQTVQAKAVCRRCPIRKVCKEWATATRMPYGVWGGESEHERVDRLRRQGIRVANSGN